MTFLGCFPPAPDHVPNATPKPRLPDIWQTMAASGLAIKPNEMIPLSGTLLAEKRPQGPQMPVQVVHDLGPARKRRKFKRTLFSEVQKKILVDWLQSHQANPYPTLIEKEELMLETGLNREQLNVWFTNNRIRHGLTGSHGHVIKRPVNFVPPEQRQFPVPLRL